MRLLPWLPYIMRSLGKTHPSTWAGGERGWGWGWGGAAAGFSNTRPFHGSHRWHVWLEALWRGRRNQWSVGEERESLSSRLWGVRHQDAELNANTSVAGSSTLPTGHVKAPSERCTAAQLRSQGTTQEKQTLSFTHCYEWGLEWHGGERDNWRFSFCGWL